MIHFSCLPLLLQVSFFTFFGLYPFHEATAQTSSVRMVLGNDCTLYREECHARLAGRIPAFGPFDVVVPFGEAGVDKAVLHVWPRSSGGACTKADQPAKGLQQRQTYVLPMTMSGEGNAREAKAQVPHLQAGQTFCFAVEWERALPLDRQINPPLLDTLRMLPRTLHSDLVSALHDNRHLYVSHYLTSINAILDAKCQSPCWRGNVDGFARALYDATLKSGVIEAYSNETKRNREQEHVEEEVTKLEELAVKYKPLTVTVIEKRYSPDRARMEAVSLSEAALEMWKADLASSGAQSIQTQKWLAWLERLIPERHKYNTVTEVTNLPKDTIQQAAAGWRAYLLESATLPTIVIRKSKLLNHEWTQKDARAASADELQEILLSLKSISTGSKTASQAQDWQTWIELFAAARSRLDETEKAVEEAGSELEQKSDALVTAYDTALTEYLRNQLRMRSLSTAVAAREAPNSANFVSPDLGVTIGTPLGQRVWFTQYAGLNIYARPVERTLPLNALVGSCTDRALQRFSLTFGVSTIAENTLRNLEVKGVLGNAMPTVGIGFRVTPFMRISALFFLYHARSTSPTSAQEFYRVAPSFGVSLDPDIIALLTNLLDG